MQQWWTNFTEGLLELSPMTWVLIAVILALGIALLVLNRKNASKKLIWGVILVGCVAIAALVLLGMPSAEIEEGASNSFLYSPAFWTIVICILGVVSLVLLLRKQRWTTQMLSTGALCVAIGFVLSCIAVYRLPNGGSITPASMLPLIIFSYIYGPIAGCTAGVVHGLLQLLQGAYVLHPVQFLLDYILPFAALGLAGLFHTKKQLPWAVLVAGLGRFIMHFLSGYVFFASYAPAGMHPFLYSLGYNASYMVPETLICLIIVCIPRVASTIESLKQNFAPKKTASE